ncbi:MULTISPECIES: 16S rRNA (uracil(1498)-N(3))-methyltransferase [Robiginitalea]|uniref:Ribosomal RNA small subunit methyltransferase E n=1 Tax=Robiginitalea biformata (strain ATCC BAA-864 / DSM 15991 / KCTC 12146 / HTCC2501) TaxID=313596 RepID=A4CK90_ROBBH|nr:MULTISPECIES: 16S rRNA (uracil(1498)-N(3))-methyltransferase [Robiginitalea]EAR15289.1 hypothetical protein RB2501_13214 [Robiginitalea biformata HTCC2501]MDC6353787.1 16S rRNA (uracil(1498)-N(3))-methyltransferase [Robiginitalea sp. PM2]MDC6374054.1 16S rRNA (uracil(1498)-N(3))-methyltransferase [Robiginitalea sp. SP8]
MNYFYHPLLDTSVNQFSFTPEESRHIVKVLRKKAGDQLHITNGKGYLFVAEILEANPERCMGKLLETRKFHPKMYSLHVAVAPTKKTDRFEWFLEKATEIGIDRITPVICQRSERRKLPMERMQRVVQEAMKQSLRTYLPELEEPVALREFLEREQPVLKFIAHCEEDEKMDLKRRVAADKDVIILIGPEGDFTHDEIQMACEKGFIPVSLGEYRLRTETAALVACTTVNLINNG